MTTNKTQSTQRQIIAQSSLKFTLEWSQGCGKCLALKEIVAVTNVIIDYVESGYSKELGERLDAVDAFLKTK
jgi:hypothetical protein